MGSIEITLPVESLEAMWDSDSAQLLAMTENEVEIEREDLHIPYIPQRKGETVTSELVVFTFRVYATVTGWRAYLKNGEIISGTTPHLHVRPGSTLGCTLTIRGIEG